VFDHPLTTADAAQRKRFEREGGLLACVDHPSVPVVLTRGLIEAPTRNIPYIAMQFVDGSTLESILGAKRRLDLPEAARVLTHVLGGLGAAHRRKIVHRDVKPSNVLVQPDGHCYLIDFSIGVSLDAPPGLTRVTKEGGQPGTHIYMSPEQKAG